MMEPAAAAEGADVVFTSVTNDDASRTVWTGPQGILSGKVKPNTLVAECSTLSHDWVLELAREARQRSLSYIDCPVTGLPDMAAAGERGAHPVAEAAGLRDPAPDMRERQAADQRLIGVAGVQDAHDIVHRVTIDRHPGIS